MFRKKIFTKIIAFFLCFVIVFCDLYNPSEAQAYEGVRDDPSACNMPDQPDQVRDKNPCYTVNFDTTKNYCEVGDFKFSAFVPVNRDLDWELFPMPGNPHCISFIALYTAILVAIHYAGRAACAGTGLGSALLSGTAIPGLGPQNILTSVLLGSLCTAAVVQCASSLGTQALACGSVVPCCGAMAAYLAAIASAVAALAIIWAIAKDFFENSKICGAGWTAWQKEEEISETEENKRDFKWLRSKGPYRRCIENLFSPGLHKTLAQLGGSSSAKTNGQVPASCLVDRGSDERIGLSIENKIQLMIAFGSITEPALSDSRSIANMYYREYIFGGMEYEDNGSGACKNPWTPEERVQILGYSSDNQRYYYVGSGEKSAPNFACSRFLRKAKSDPNSTQSREAYDCCVNRSQSAICIENKSEYIFCENASKCYLGAVNVEVYNAKKGGDYMCAKSYSLCPYNVPLAGGTENDAYDSNPEYADVKLNFCQHLNHCVKRPLLPTIKSSSLTGSYISSACYDMKGDSQNSYQYNAGLSPIAIRNFTAPFVQCFTETMQNIFTNRAGRDICSDPSFDEMVGCGGAENIQYRAGDFLPDDQSFFIKIQNNYQMILKLALTFSIIMLGISILMAVPKQHLEKKVLMQYMIKMLLVVFFALGNGWHIGFANSVVGVSTAMANVTFFPNLFDGALDKVDGCVFPRFNYESANSANRDYNVRQYPPGKDYLRVWDTLDCKIVRALGYSGNISVPNIILMMIAGFFTGAFGVIMFVASFIFGFVLLSIALRAMHIFLISMSGVVILLFVSPVTITMVMFERTKGIFTNWWKQLVGFSLQPMILFIYISIFLTVFDIILVGSARYSGSIVEIKGANNFYTGATKINEQKFIDNYGYIQEKKLDCSGEASDNSIYCIFYAPKFGSLSGFNAIGFGIPILKDLNQQKIETIAKAALLMFIFLNFMDQMTTFSSKLVGGATIASNWSIKPSDLVRNFNWAMRGIQKRGTRGLLKAGRAAIPQISNLRSAVGDIKNIRNARRDAINAAKDDDKKDSDNKPDNDSDKNKADSPDSAKAGDSSEKTSDKPKDDDSSSGDKASDANKDEGSPQDSAKRESPDGNSKDGGGSASGSAGGGSADSASGGGSAGGSSGGSAGGSSGAGGGDAGGDGSAGKDGAAGGDSGGANQDMAKREDGPDGGAGGSGSAESSSESGDKSTLAGESGSGGGDGSVSKEGGEAGVAEGGEKDQDSGGSKGDLARREDEGGASGGESSGDSSKSGGPNSDGASDDSSGGKKDGEDQAKDGSSAGDKNDSDAKSDDLPPDGQSGESAKSSKGSDDSTKPSNPKDGETRPEGSLRDQEKDDSEADTSKQDSSDDEKKSDDDSAMDQDEEDSGDKDDEKEEGNLASSSTADGGDKGARKSSRGGRSAGSGKQNGVMRSRSSSPSRSRAGGSKSSLSDSAGGKEAMSKGIMEQGSGLSELMKSEGIMGEVTKGALGGSTNKGILSGSLDSKSKSSEPLPWLGALGGAIGGVLEPSLKAVSNTTDNLFGIKGNDRSSGTNQVGKANARSTSAYSAGSAMNAMSKGSTSQSKGGVKESVSDSLVLKDPRNAQKSGMLSALKQSSDLDAKGGGKSQSGGGSALDLSSVILSPKTGDMKSDPKVYSSGPAKEVMSSSPAKSSGSSFSVASSLAFKTPPTSQPASSSSPSSIGQTGSKSPAVGVQKTAPVVGNTSAKSTGGFSLENKPDSKMASAPAQTSAAQQSRSQGMVSNVSPQEIKLDFSQAKTSNASSGGGSAVIPSASSAFEAVSKSSQAESSSAGKAPADLVKESLARVRSQQSGSAGGGQVEQSQKTSTASPTAQANAKSPTPFNDALGKYIGDPLSKGIDPVASAISNGVDNLFGFGQQKSSSPVSSQVNKAISSKKFSPTKTSKPSGGVEIEEVEFEFEEDDQPIQPIQPSKSSSSPQITQNSKTVVTPPPAPKQQANQQQFDPWAGFNQFFDDLTGNKKK